jgi:hypothetical protein
MAVACLAVAALHVSISLCILWLVHTSRLSFHILESGFEVFHFALLPMFGGIWSVLSLVHLLETPNVNGRAIAMAAVVFWVILTGLGWLLLAALRA